LLSYDGAQGRPQLSSTTEKDSGERVFVLVDCDNTKPENLE
jgi:hypothetical protein